MFAHVLDFFHYFSHSLMFAIGSKLGLKFGIFTTDDSNLTW
jgi:hypothetical protein